MKITRYQLKQIILKELGVKNGILLHEGVKIKEFQDLIGMDSKSATGDWGPKGGPTDEAWKTFLQDHNNDVGENIDIVKVGLSWKENSGSYSNNLTGIIEFAQNIKDVKAGRLEREELEEKLKKEQSEKATRESIINFVDRIPSYDGNKGDYTSWNLDEFIVTKSFPSSARTNGGHKINLVMTFAYSTEKDHTFTLFIVVPEMDGRSPSEKVNLRVIPSQKIKTTGTYTKIEGFMYSDEPYLSDLAGSLKDKTVINYRGKPIKGLALADLVARSFKANKEKVKAGAQSLADSKLDNS